MSKTTKYEIHYGTYNPEIRPVNIPEVIEPREHDMQFSCRNMDALAADVTLAPDAMTNMIFARVGRAMLTGLYNIVVDEEKASITLLSEQIDPTIISRYTVTISPAKVRKVSRKVKNA